MQGTSAKVTGTPALDPAYRPTCVPLHLYRRAKSAATVRSAADDAAGRLNVSDKTVRAAAKASGRSATWTIRTEPYNHLARHAGLDRYSAVMNADTWIPLLTAAIAGLVALIGYSLTQFANRRERKSKSYAEALAAIRQYQELPYLIRRRSESSSTTRSALAQQISEVMAKLGFYRAWLQMDSDTTSTAYDDLVERARQLGRVHLKTAWVGKVIEHDADMIGTQAPFDWTGIIPELDLCVRAMRVELSLWGFISRVSIRRSLARQHQKRAREEEP
jgi:hypothetical protein